MSVAYYEGSEIELAKFTLSVAEELDKVDTERQLKARAEKMHKVMVTIVGADKLTEIVDGSDYKTCDLVKLVDLFNCVNDAYKDDMNRSRNARMEEQMDRVSEMSGKLEGFTAAANRIKK